MEQMASSPSAVAGSSNDRPLAVDKELRDDTYETLKSHVTSMQIHQSARMNIRESLARLRHRYPSLPLTSRMKQQRKVRSDGDTKLKSDPSLKRMTKWFQSSMKKAEVKSDKAESRSVVDDEPVSPCITAPQSASPSATCPAGTAVVPKDRTPDNSAASSLFGCTPVFDWDNLEIDSFCEIPPSPVVSQIDTPPPYSFSPELSPVFPRRRRHLTTLTSFRSQPSCSSSDMASIQAPHEMSKHCLPDGSDSTDSDSTDSASENSVSMMVSVDEKNLSGHGLKRRRRAKKAHVNVPPFPHDHYDLENALVSEVGGFSGETGWESYDSHEEIIDVEDVFPSLDLKASDGSRRKSDDACPSYYSSVNRYEYMSMQSESASGGDSDAQVEMGVSITDLMEMELVPRLQQSMFPSLTDLSGSERECLARSHSVPSLSGRTSFETFLRSESLPSMVLKTSFREFTPEFDEEDEAYRFQCSSPGLYLCSVTGLMFQMEGEGDVVYRTTPWDRKLLAQHHKQPAGPLFDIKCTTPSVQQLHLPHCEIRSTGGCGSLSVAHVDHDVIEFLKPHQVTETHVVIRVSGFSAFGNIKDDELAPEPVRALVLLFYNPPTEPETTSLLNVLLLPRNVVLQGVLRSRKKLNWDEIYLETSPHCKLKHKQEYTLSTRPEDDSVLVQPKEAEFDSDNYDNYFPSFQVDLEKVLKHLTLFLRGADSQSVWERRVCLSSTGGKKSCRSVPQNLPADKKLLNVRCGFIEAISAPVLKDLLDKLFDIRVMTNSERQWAGEINNQRERARFVIDTTWMKGEAASQEMIDYLCDVDPFLCEHLELI